MPWADVWRQRMAATAPARTSRRAARERVEESLALVGMADFAKAFPINSPAA